MAQDKHIKKHQQKLEVLREEVRNRKQEIVNNIDVDKMMMLIDIDDDYDVLNTTIYEKTKAVKVSYKEVNPSERVTENFSYIVQKLNNISENSEVVGEE